MISWTTFLLIFVGLSRHCCASAPAVWNGETWLEMFWNEVLECTLLLFACYLAFAVSTDVNYLLILYRMS